MGTINAAPKAVNAISAKRIHELFGLLLHQYRVDSALIGPLKSALLAEYNEMNKEGLEQQIIFNNQLKEINLKIDNLEES